MNTWWVGWTFPEAHQRDKRIAAAWPPGVKGWATGSGGDEDDSYTTWCARVDAPSADVARALIASMYGELAVHIRWRFDPTEHPLGWRPSSDRFHDDEAAVAKAKKGRAR